MLNENPNYKRKHAICRRGCGISTGSIYWHDEERTVNINGYVPLTAEEYAGNESIANLEAVVRQSVADRLLDEVVAE